MQLTFVVLTCFLVYLSNAWILLGHRNKLGSDSKDKSYDRYYTQFSAQFSFIFILTLEAIFAFRRLCIEFGNWEEVKAHLLFAKYLDFLALPTSLSLLTLGFFIFIAGLVLRIWAIRILGRFFTFEIGIRKEHQIINQGPYQFVRHPSYSGYLLMTIGMGIVYASGLNLVWLFGSCLFFLSIRIFNEEKMLRNHFGEAYTTYSKKTKRLIPFLY